MWKTGIRSWHSCLWLWTKNWLFADYRGKWNYLQPCSPEERSASGGRLMPPVFWWWMHVLRHALRWANLYVQIFDSLSDGFARMGRAALFRATRWGFHTRC